MEKFPHHDVKIQGYNLVEKWKKMKMEFILKKLWKEKMTENNFWTSALKTEQEGLIFK